VRDPREPDEKPPPMRASAEETAITVGSASARAIATAFARALICCVNLMVFS